MKCPKCSAELTGTEKFCYNCGSEITNNLDNNAPTITENTPVNDAATEQVTPTVESVPTAEVVSEQVTPTVESVPTAEVATEQVTPTVESVSAAEVATEQVTPAVESVPTSEVATEQVTPTVESVPTAEVATEQVTPTVESVPSADVAPEQTEEPKKVKSNKSMIVIAIVLLLVVLGTAVFFTFKDYFIKDNNPTNGDIIEDDTNNDINETPKNVSLVCNRITDGLNSIVEISYVDGKVENYGMSYSMNTYNMSEEQVNTFMAEYNTIYSKVSAFENESGFSISNTDSIDEEFGARTLNLYYTIKVSAVTNDKILELIDDKDLTIVEKSTNMKAQGYICN